jgi:peptidoglycan/xylan/chitin deacetylase (PgdA/CDA1 family)
MDDGPVPGTAKVLDLLKRKGVHATFFVVGQMARLRPGLVRRMVREGHVVGNHTWNHPEFFGARLKTVRGQLIRTARVVRRATGHDPVLMRPPFGEVTGKLLTTTRKLGEAVVLWDVDPRDWKDRKASTVVKRVVKRAKPGSIILTHDSLKSTRKAYARIIDGLHKRGFTLVTVPQLFGGKLKPGKVYLRR